MTRHITSSDSASSAAFVYWHNDHYRVEFEAREFARFSEDQRENAVDFANGFNLGHSTHQRELEADRDRLAMALERIARVAESSPPHLVAELAWQALTARLGLDG